MEYSEIFEKLQIYIASKESTGETLTKKERKKLDVLKSITVEMLSLGNKPQYFFARMECNSTAVGSSYYDGTETRRTVAQDYVTPEYLFIDGHEGTCKKGLELFYLKANQTINYYKKDDIKKVANRYGYLMHAQNFRDLNFTVSSHRINRYKVHLTRDPFSFPIQPIYVQMPDAEDKSVIGYLYEFNGSENVIIEPEKITTSKKSIVNGTFFKILLFICCPPIGIIWTIIDELKEK